MSNVPTLCIDLQIDKDTIRSFLFTLVDNDALPSVHRDTPTMLVVNPPDAGDSIWAGHQQPAPWNSFDDDSDGGLYISYQVPYEEPLSEFQDAFETIQTLETLLEQFCDDYNIDTDRINSSITMTMR